MEEGGDTGGLVGWNGRTGILEQYQLFGLAFVSSTCVMAQAQVSSCLELSAASKLKSKYSPRADVTHQCKASSDVLPKGRCTSCTITEFTALEKTPESNISSNPSN